ncbi:MAG TPA: RnfABCDGE type electron transport complex subunit D, partial [Steroidobacteraceae bacterium]|nr:RnfABCDGE type electron transport complex subunit D [Steroidobacteraceae bacterium]
TTALALPPYAPWWLTLVAVGFAIVFGKQLYGGLGQNPFNPAMLGYVVALISFPVHARIDNGKLGFSVVFRFGGAKVGYGSSARGPPSSIGGVPILYQTAADAGLPWLPSWDTAAKVLLPGYLSFSEAQRAFRDPYCA